LDNLKRSLAEEKRNARAIDELRARLLKRTISLITSSVHPAVPGPSERRGAEVKEELEELGGGDGHFAAASPHCA
jgi:hypothetical protein